MQIASKLRSIMAALAAGLIASAAQAQEEVLPKLEVIGKPAQDGIHLQTPATDLMKALVWYDNFLLWVISAISLLVLVLLLIVVFRFNAKANPTPAKFTHNSVLEVTWTIVPIVILVALIPFSLSLLFKQMEIPEGDVVIKTTGNQWFWSYEYPDEGIAFDSFMLAKDELADHGYDQSDYLLATDTAVVVPTGKVVVVQVTGADVIHSWTIPAFGVKQDAVPGRLAELWFKVEPGMEGVYYGQCSELCGKDHSYMPITVKAVTPEDYEKWLARAKEEYASIKPATRVASAGN